LPARGRRTPTGNQKGVSFFAYFDLLPIFCTYFFMFLFANVASGGKWRWNGLQGTAQQRKK
jgi:hypothetical protein